MRVAVPPKTSSMLRLLTFLILMTNPSFSPLSLLICALHRGSTHISSYSVRIAEVSDIRTNLEGRFEALCDPSPGRSADNL